MKRHCLDKGGYAELEDGKDSKEEKISLLGEDWQDSSPFKTTASASQIKGIKSSIFDFIDQNL